jgi:hypothetical protein
MGTFVERAKRDPKEAAVAKKAAKKAGEQPTQLRNNRMESTRRTRFYF